MSRSPTILIWALVLIIGPGPAAWGITVRAKSADTSQVATPPTPSDVAVPSDSMRTVAPAGPLYRAIARRRLLERLRRQVRQAQAAGRKQYDDYIDADHDGVDDRVEVRGRPMPKRATGSIPDSTKKPVIKRKKP
ncbi:MAG: hypothetical protein HY304_03140 [candidate division Zixibacteria bacterium]|nr:hypothetical protein [candidate division Zixibacteria bacterium]